MTHRRPDASLDLPGIHRDGWRPGRRILPGGEGETACVEIERKRHIIVSDALDAVLVLLAL